MAGLTLEALLRKELEENKTLTNSERLDILRRLAILESKKLTLKFQKNKQPKEPKKPPVHTRLPGNERLVEEQTQVPLGQRVGKILEELKGDGKEVHQGSNQEAGQGEERGEA